MKPCSPSSLPPNNAAKTAAKPCDSRLAVGHIWHQRFSPIPHRFGYGYFMAWLALDEIPELAKQLRGFGLSRWHWARFHRPDYLGDAAVPLVDAVIAKISELAGQPVQGRIWLLGQLRYLGFYFSPVNFYFVQQADGQFSHMLAEVSNTPWQQRHCYLVDLQHAPLALTDKSFTVSPFNHLDMQYRWRVDLNQQQIRIDVDCLEPERCFTASLQLQPRALSRNTLLRQLVLTPMSTLSSVLKIYWQATVLWCKGLPFYGYNGKRPQ